VSETVIEFLGRFVDNAASEKNKFCLSSECNNRITTKRNSLKNIHTAIKISDFTEK
jgi:hypothetical protein